MVSLPYLEFSVWNRSSVDDGGVLFSFNRVACDSFVFPIGVHPRNWFCCNGKGVRLGVADDGLGRIFSATGDFNAAGDATAVTADAGELNDD